MGKNSRGVTQYIGSALEEIVTHFDNTIDYEKSVQFLEELSDLLPPPKEAGASWDVPTTVGIITKLSPLAQRFMIFLR
jgi:hypothetical protein